MNNPKGDECDLARSEWTESFMDFLISQLMLPPELIKDNYGTNYASAIAGGADHGK